MMAAFALEADTVTRVPEASSRARDMGLKSSASRPTAMSDSGVLVEVSNTAILLERALET